MDIQYEAGRYYREDGSSRPGALDRLQNKRGDASRSAKAAMGFPRPCHEPGSWEGMQAYKRSM